MGMIDRREEYLPPLNKDGSIPCSICGVPHFREDPRRLDLCGTCNNEIDRNLKDLEKQHKERLENEAL